MQTLVKLQELTMEPLLHSLRSAFLRGRTKSYAWRLEQLQNIKKLLINEKKLIDEAVQKDLGRCAFESTIAEYGAVKQEVEYAMKHLRNWMRPQRVSTSLITEPAKSWMVHEPLGVMLILGPWNYPVNLVLMPLLAAVAAGNCAVIKPSELTPHTSKILSQLIPKYLDKECIAVIEGGVEVAQALLEQRFDHIFYTGGMKAASEVMRAAAQHLTPVTLELGGKSPCIVDKHLDLNVCARRLIWAKFFNAGQTCLAPDYVLVHHEIEAQFIQACKNVMQEFYGNDPKSSPDFARIVNTKHHQRLTQLLLEQTILVGGQNDVASLYLAPTLVKPKSLQAAIMQEEIFGPILPIVSVQNIDEAVKIINNKSKPLSLYIFSRDTQVQQHILENTSSGGVCINDAMYQVATPTLPFGGVGQSGMGSYHGKFGFETFSHRKSIMLKRTFLDPSFRYPPYNESKLKWLYRLFGKS